MAGNTPGRVLDTQRGVKNEQTRHIVRRHTPSDTLTITSAQPHWLPPYGRKLLNQRPRPADELRLYFGDAEEVWNHARLRNVYAPPALVLPPGISAESFRWPVAGWPVFAIQCGDFPIEEIRKLAYRMLQSGAQIFRVLYGENPDFAIFRPAYRKVEQ